MDKHLTIALTVGAELFTGSDQLAESSIATIAQRFEHELREKVAELRA